MIHLVVHLSNRIWTAVSSARLFDGGEVSVSRSALWAYVSALVLSAGVGLAVTLTLALGAASSWIVVPVFLLGVLVHLTPYGARGPYGSRDVVYIDFVAVVVALMVLPTPLAVLTCSAAALTGQFLDMGKGTVRVRMLFNAGHTCLLVLVQAVGIAALAPAAGLSRAAVASCIAVAVDAVLGHLMVSTAMRLGGRSSPGLTLRVVLDPVGEPWVQPLFVAAGAAAGALSTAPHGVWLLLAVFGLLLPVARGRLRALDELDRAHQTLELVRQISDAPDEPTALASLTRALSSIADVQQFRIETSQELAVAGEMRVPLSGTDVEPDRWLAVETPPTHGRLYRGREEAVRSVLTAAAHALRGLELAAALRFESRHDPLTGLVNRRHLSEVAQAELGRALRSGRGAALLYLDLNHFKAVNDDHGHEAGDALLIAVANRLRGLVRPHDVVARLGGDEFAVLLVDLHDTDTTADLCGRVREAFSGGWTQGELALPVTASVGVARCPEHGTTLDGLLRAADAHMYEQKRAR